MNDETLDRKNDPEESYLLHRRYLSEDAQTTLDPLLAREIANETVQDLETNLRQDVVSGRIYDQLNQLYDIDETPDDIRDIVEASTYSGEVDYDSLARELEDELGYEGLPGEEIVDIVVDEDVENIIEGAYITGSSNYGMTLAPDSILHQHHNESNNHYSSSDIDLTILISDVEANYIDNAFEYFYEESNEVQGDLNNNGKIELQPGIIKKDELLSGIKNGKRDFKAGKDLQYIALPIVDGENFEMQRTYPEFMADSWAGISAIPGFRSKEFESEILEGIDIVTYENGDLKPGMYDRIVDYLKDKHGRKENSRTEALEENIELGLKENAKRNWEELDRSRHSEGHLSFKEGLKDLVLESDIDLENYFSGTFNRFDLDAGEQSTLDRFGDMPEALNDTDSELASRALDRAIEEHPDFEKVRVDGEWHYETHGVRTNANELDAEEVMAGAVREKYGRMISEGIERFDLDDSSFGYFSNKELGEIERMFDVIEKEVGSVPDERQSELDKFS